jgi:hypothetical protein
MAASWFADSARFSISRSRRRITSMNFVALSLYITAGIRSAITFLSSRFLE